MNALKKVALLCAFLLAIPAFAQTAVSGTKVQDGSGTGALLASGQWCFASTCISVTNGAFTGSVTAGTQTVTVKNASAATILTVPDVVVGSAAFNWDLYVVPTNASISGTGEPTIACQVGATYAQTDSTPANAVWSCISFAGQQVWASTVPVTPVESGFYAGVGAPTFTCTVPCAYQRTDTNTLYLLSGSAGSSGNSWVAAGGSGGTTTNALTVNSSGGASPGATFNGSSPVTLDYHSLGAQGALTLTTTGTSGASTLSGNTLNIPQYSGGGGGVTFPTGVLYGNNSTSAPTAATITQLGGTLFDSNGNSWISDVLPSAGWPLPSGIVHDLVWGHDAALALGNYTPINTTGTASSGSTTLTVASATGIGTFMNVSGAGIPSGDTVASIAGTTVTLAVATTAALSSTPVAFTPGGTSGLIAIGEFACQSCVSNNGSVVLGNGALQNDVGNGDGGEDINGVFLGPFAGYGDPGGAACAYGGSFEPILIGNKVGNSGCGWSATQMIGNHIYQITGASDSTIIGGEIGSTLGATAWVKPSESIFIGRGIFSPTLYGFPAPAAGTYTVSNTNCLGSGSCLDAFNTHDNNVIGTGSFVGPTGGTLITGIQNFVGGNGVLSGCTTCSYNVVIGGVSALSLTTASQISTGASNVFIGPGAGAKLTTSSGSTIVGADAGETATTAIITAFGQGACQHETGGSVACFGPYAGSGLTTGTNDVVTGVANAGGDGPTGASSNDATYGVGAGAGETGSFVSYFGSGAGHRVPAGTLGSNEAFGYNEFHAGSGSLGTEQYDAFFGDTSSCGGCTYSIGLGHAANIGTSTTHAVQIDGGSNATSNTMQYQSWNFLDASGNVNAKLLVASHGASAIASATTIAPSAYITHISGTAAISTITPPTVTTNGGVFSGCIHLIPDGAFTTVTGGNIALASTAVVNRELEECYDGTSWYPSY